MWWNFGYLRHKNDTNQRAISQGNLPCQYDKVSHLNRLRRSEWRRLTKIWSGFPPAHWTLPTPCTRPTCRREFACAAFQLQPCLHASGAHRGRTGISLLQTLVAVGRCPLRAVASRSKNLGSGNSSFYFHSSPRIPAICAVSVSGCEQSEAEKELNWKTEHISGGQRSDVPRGWFSLSPCWVTSDSSFSFPTWKYGNRSQKWAVWPRIEGAQLPLWRTDFSFWFFVFFSAFGLFFSPQEMSSCSLTDAGIGCWSSQDAGNPTTSRSLTLRQFFGYFSPVDVTWTWTWTFSLLCF